MKAAFVTLFTMLLSTTAQAATCKAKLTDLKKGTTQILSTAAAPDRPNTIVAGRTFGLQLAVQFNADGSAKDVSNYLNKFSEGSLMWLGGTPIAFDSNGTLKVVQSISFMPDSDPKGTVELAYEMTCQK